MPRKGKRTVKGKQTRRTRKTSKVFRISGRVIDSISHHGVSGLRVEAWDRDLIWNDVVGSAVTTEDGAFRMLFDESYFKELFLDRRPDLFFKVFRGDKLIKSTEDSVLWNEDREDIEMTIEVDGDSGFETPSSKESWARSILQATYTPRKPAPGEAPSIAPRALEKGAFVDRLRPSQEELDELTKRYRKAQKQPRAGDTTRREKALETVEIISAAISHSGEISILRNAKQFALLDADTLASVAQDLIELRQETIDAASIAHKRIREQFTKRSMPEEASLAAGWVSVKTLMEWAIKNNVETQSAVKSLAVGEVLQMRLDTIGSALFRTLASRRIDHLRNLIYAYGQSMDTEPVGYLHLEKMCFTPAGIGRGGLVYSLPLSPGEEANIKHREWSHTSEEFERIVTDYMEEFSEKGVTEKSELSESVNSESQHSTAFNAGVTVSGSYGSVNVSSTVGYNASDSASKSEQLSRNQSIDITHKASSRSKKEHKISFRVASAVETEDQTVRRIKNPYTDRATRVDYYQLIRKWQVDLYRYGIRLTYDIVIPEPGAGLIYKLEQIQEIRRALEEPFEFPVVLGRTGETPEDYVVLNHENYTLLAGQYGAMVEDPPLSEVKKTIPRLCEPEEGSSYVPEVFTIDVEIPENYTLDAVVALGPYGWDFDYANNELFIRLGNEMLYRWKVEDNTLVFDESLYPDFDHAYTGWDGGSEKVQFGVSSKNIKRVFLQLQIRIKVRAEVYEAWRLKAFKAIYDAAQARYYENRQKLNDKLARLQEELGAQDALSLRKKEREEVMKGTLEVLGFPPDQYNENDKIIKFLHHAIEWENMLYFLYPYFWSDPGDDEEYWEFKRYLDHPDPTHRAFLKSGKARVVLTIRPGFEMAFLKFVNTGEINYLPHYPYLSIGQEFQLHAKTNYAGIPPANPVENYRMLLYPKQMKAWEDMQLIMKLLEEYRKRPYSSQRKAWKDMHIIMKFLEEYRRLVGRYPSTEQGLATLQQYFPNENIEIVDPWGNGYVYASPGIYGDYDLASYGADGAPGGEGENADIVSWEERDEGEYPSSLEILNESFANEEMVPLVDPWGNNYVYTNPGLYGEYDLVSYGADGQPGGDGENADITNWAEASLIGRWYEYTPTSALDIAFDETLPPL